MTRMMKLTALTMATLAGALVASTAMADRGNGMGPGDGMGMEQGMGMEDGMGPMMRRAGPFAGFDFAAVDSNKDGKITKEELAAWRAARVQALDTDGDGLISADELAAAQIKAVDEMIKARAAKMVERLDSNGDGKLSAAEMAEPPMPQRLFDRVDTNKDGAISQDEIDAAKERMAQRMERGDHGMRGKHKHRPPMEGGADQ